MQEPRHNLGQDSSFKTSHNGCEMSQSLRISVATTAKADWLQPTLWLPNMRLRQLENLIPPGRERIRSPYKTSRLSKRVVIRCTSASRAVQFLSRSLRDGVS